MMTVLYMAAFTSERYCYGEACAARCHAYTRAESIRLIMLYYASCARIMAEKAPTTRRSLSMSAIGVRPSAAHRAHANGGII